jgi:hypothetical protein
MDQSDSSRFMNSETMFYAVASHEPFRIDYSVWK